MIHFDDFTLANGLRVLVHEDHSTPVVAFNVLYDVGSRDESPDKTGFAHLFEHLMFGGSQHIPSYDAPLQRVGGDNNAFTSPDLTNYYISLPAANIETAFWLESDRMLSLSFDPQVLDVQRQVVVEEFKQRYLNQPYGDLWLKMRPLAYQVHPYRWATIGKEISHIEEATMEDVKAFFAQHYVPANAILVLAGHIHTDEARRLAEKWFGPIPGGTKPLRQLPQEPVQTAARSLDVVADVPLHDLHIAFHVGARRDPDFHATDLVSDLLGRGKSSLLYHSLVQDQKIFNQIGASVTGSIDPGLLIIGGKINPGIRVEEAEEALWKLIDEFVENGPDAYTLQKVKNQAESSLLISEAEVLNRAMNLAYATLLGDPQLFNQEAASIQAVTVEQAKAVARKVLHRNNSNTLRYRSASQP